RKLIAEQVAYQILFPQTVKWLKDKLSTAASERVALTCQANLERKIGMAPFVIPGSEEEIPTVLSISWGDGTRTSPAFGIVLNENGEMVHFLKLDKLIDRDRLEDVKALQEVIDSFSPDVVVLGGFKANTKTMLLKILQEEVVSGSKKRDLPIYLVDDEVARIYMNSNVAAREFPETDYPRLIPYCVSLGRFAQDPTCEYAGLFNKDEDVKHLRLDPLQKLLPDDILLKAIERGFINVVNFSGVDINSAAGFPHKAHTLPFVSGLGPRKAQAMISKIVRSGGKLASRADLIQNEICASVVFVNCASFLRIRALHFRASYRDSSLDVLDDTRVHPEDYELARKMAADALDLDDVVLEEDESPSQHVQELMEGDVGRLNLLLLDDYAVELERRMHQPKRVCLNDIKKELMEPYRDHRRKFESVGEKDCFTMLTGESLDNLYEGAVVNAVVIRVKERFLNVAFGAGVEGQVYAGNIDLPYGDQTLTRLFRENQALLACVIKVNFDRMIVDLSLKEADVKNAKPRLLFDEYFDFQAQEAEQAGRSNRAKISKQVTKRIVQHPFWQSIDYKKAEEYLSTRPRGEVVVRPSTKGNDHISITWKVDEGIFKHIDVKEQDKPTNRVNGLGQTLIIGSTKYNEIDQIIAEYIDPMTRRINLLIEHPKYQRKSLHEMCKRTVC
ncbi:Transcription elongation factor spt6, partial [Kappamyces sp. JEL0680]